MSTTGEAGMAQGANGNGVATRRVLTIDGGGVRGAFAAAIIEQMEIKTGKPANQIFDFICGTSAGAVLAVGLARGLPAAVLKEEFIKLGKSAFSGAGPEQTAGKGGGQSPDLLTRISGAFKMLFNIGPERSNGHTPPRSHADFEEALKTLVGGPDIRPRDLDCSLAIPARNMRIGRTVLFGNLPPDLYPDQESFVDNTGIDENDELWEVLRRSTALPPFFSPAGDYLDGGVSPFANPSYLAYAGALYRLGWNPCESALRFYSVGTAFHEKSFDMKRLTEGQIKDAMIEALMQDINFLQHQVMKARGHDRAIWYKRYNLALTRKGFEKFGWEVPAQDVLDRLASTNAPPVEELAALGTRVGRATVLASDFDAGVPLPDRREQAWDRRSGSRRLSLEMADPEADDQSKQRRRDRRRRDRRRRSGPVPATSAAG